MMNPESTRAGTLQPFAGGGAAFLPAPLPPDPPLDLGGELRTVLSRADIALGRLDGSVSTLPHPDLFVMMYVRKEAVLSSQIEGTQSSLDDLVAAEARVFDPARPQDVEEVINYVAALRLGLERLESLPVSVRLLNEIHGKLLSGVRGEHRAPGELRRTQNWIGPSDSPIAMATFVPPPADRVPEAMSRLEQFLDSKSDDLPALVKIGLAHAQFETVHPYLDGNGRLGRLLIALLLCEGGILRQPVLYLSHFFKQHRAEYYDRLQAVRMRGDWEGWLAFFLRGVVQVGDEAAVTCARILELRERHRGMLVDRLGKGAANGIKLLESLYGMPLTNVKAVGRLLEVTPPAANTLVARFVELGILRETTGNRRNRRFVYDEYMQLFQ